MDYIGAVQGIPVCFDAKECAASTFPLANVHPHQIQFMRDFEEQGGVSFLLLFFNHLDKLYYLRLKKFLEFWERKERGGRKSFTIQELEPEFYLEKHGSILVPYLDGLQRDLDMRD